MRLIADREVSGLADSVLGRFRERAKLRQVAREESGLPGGVASRDADNKDCGSS